MTGASARAFPLHVGHLEVVATERVTPRTARLTLAAPEVADFPDDQGGEVITLLWSEEPGGAITLPHDGWRFPAGAPRPHWRNFTIRSLDRARERIEVDFALHATPGRAVDWGRDARPGDRVGFAGPRTHFEFDPTADWTLMCADETGLPAVAAALERLPAGHRATAFVEVVDVEEELVVESAADVELVWLHRGGVSANDSPLMERAVRAWVPPPGRGTVWAGAEATVVRRLRDFWRGELGWELGAFQARGYWKHRATREDVDSDDLGS